MEGSYLELAKAVGVPAGWIVAAVAAWWLLRWVGVQVRELLPLLSARANERAVRLELAKHGVVPSPLPPRGNRGGSG